MKIQNDDLIKNLYSETTTQRQSTVGSEFDAILKQTVKNTKTEVTGHRQTTFINPLNAIQPSTFSEREKQVALDRVENFIDLLDQYQQKLADSRLKLKHIDPIIKELNQEKENLTPVLDSIPDDEELKNILNQALVTATLEVGKFYRGDYLALANYRTPGAG